MCLVAGDIITHQSAEADSKEWALSCGDIADGESKRTDACQEQLKCMVGLHVLKTVTGLVEVREVVRDQDLQREGNRPVLSMNSLEKEEQGHLGQ